MTITAETTVGEVVAADFRAAAVLNRFGIDFCCGGKRTLADACRARMVDAAHVLTEVSAACAPSEEPAPRFNEWEPQTLVAYIVGTHHTYVRGALPMIGGYVRKLAATHGAKHPELLEVERLWGEISAEMTAHMAKEEQVLFPYIVQLADAVPRREEVIPPPFGSIELPIRMMEHEHESAGAAVARINEITGGYLPPTDGCTTYRVCFEELKGFEQNLHAHVHLENNVLFPKARILANP
jgi:regulator of cell morphogenesis and NO signaling